MFEIESRFERKTYLLNCEPSKGASVIDGKAVEWDKTEITCLVPRKNRDGRMGLDVEKLVWGKSENASKLAHLQFASCGPLQVVLTCENALTGKGDKQKTVTVVHDLRLVQPNDSGLTNAPKKAA